MKSYQQGAIVALFLVILASSFAGTAPGPLSYVHETCKDGLDNDMDGVYGGQYPLILQDFQDGECVWMPQKFGSGEHDGLGLTDPTPQDANVAAYVSAWNSAWSSEMPTHFQIIQAAADAGLTGTCTQDVQEALMTYKNDFGLPNEMTGANEHMAECGVSY